MPQRMKIGVMGSASGPTIKNPENIRKARLLGREIARRKCILINGACPGLPDHAAEGARAAGGFVMGVSPAFSLEEHRNTYGSPFQHYDLILFSGLGLMERDIINIRSSDGIVVIGGGMGTLNEFTVAFEERKVIGVLTGTGGVADRLEEILGFCNRKIPPSLLFDDDPRRLVTRTIAAIETHEGPTHDFEVGGEKERLREKLQRQPEKVKAEVTRRLRRQKAQHDRAYE